MLKLVTTMKHNKQISDKWLFCFEVMLKLKSGRHTLMVCLGYYIGKNLTSKNAGPQSIKSSLSVLIRSVCVIFSRLFFIINLTMKLWQGPTVKGTVLV